MKGMEKAYYKHGVILLIVLMFSSPIFAQRGIFVMGGLEFGSTEKNYNFQQGGAKLDKDWLMWERGGDHDADDPYTNDKYGNQLRVNASLSLNYIFLRHFGISAGVKLMGESIIVHDKDFMERYDIHGPTYNNIFDGTRANLGNFNFKKLYVNPNIMGYYIFNSKQTAEGPYIGYGIGSNKFISNNPDVSGAYYYAAGNEYMELKAHFLKSFNNQYLELGYFFAEDNEEVDAKPGLKMATRGAVASVAFRYSFVQNYVEADYLDMKNGKTQYTDHLTSTNGYLSVVLKFGGGIFTNSIDRVYEHRYDKKVAKVDEPKAEKKKTDVVRVPKKVKGRNVDYKKEIIVRSSEITVYVWDHGRYDKDIISIDMNGNWILENDTLKKEKKAIKVNVQEGINYMAFFAISEGTEKPCTLSVMIDDGFTQQTLILNSDMKNSEAITIKFVP